MRRVGVAVLLCGLACAGKPVPVTSPTLSDVRLRVLESELAWINDSTPVVRFNPPFVYGAWRLEIEHCSRLTRYGWPRFYVAPISPIMAHGERYAAIYSPASNSIVFALGEESRKAVVAHELLHWLLVFQIPYAPVDETATEASVRVHPTEYFDKRCGELLKS